MCSITSGLYERKLYWTISTAHNSTTIYNDEAPDLSTVFNFVVYLVAYIIILVSLLAVVLYFIVKFFGLLEGDSENLEDFGPRENNPLIRPGKAVSVTCYGTCEGDLETGNCSYGCISNSSKDLYDGKVCVVCYDEQRDCFFVPCGHCATCYVCAKRIFDVESKTCPVCRRVIGKVRKL